MADIRPEIVRVRDLALRRVDDLHDDHVRVARLWREVFARDRYGLPPLVVRNARTGSLTETAAQWVEHALESNRRARVRTFKDLAAEVELFVDRLLRVWLTRFPSIVDGRSIPLAEILSATDLAGVMARAIAAAVDATIFDKLKARPATWFAVLRQILGCTIPGAGVAAFAERKAARDALEHHDGVVDPAYLIKAREAALLPVGSTFEPDDATIDALHAMVGDLIRRIAADAIAHFPLAEAAETGAPN
jgi:hypothetical protein